MELGIHRGGSAALVAAAARPSRLVAVDLSSQRADLLDRFISERALADVIRPYYGLDQASPELRLTVDRELGGEDLDLVLDDASHLYGPTRKSFEMLFPRLRAGGVYVIEDWAGQHTLLASAVDGVVNRSAGWQRIATSLASSIEASDASLAASLRENPGNEIAYAAARAAARSIGEPPLSRLVQELVVMSAQTRDVIRSITVTQGWTEITRGAGELGGPDWLARGTYDYFPPGSQASTADRT